MPVPVHPDDPMARCAFCPSVFLARNAADKAFVEAHEAGCQGNPTPKPAGPRCTCYDSTLTAAWCPVHSVTYPSTCTTQTYTVAATPTSYDHMATYGGETAGGWPY